MSLRPMAIAVTLGVACAGVGAPAAATATTPGVNGKIVFARTPSGGQGTARSDLYSVNPDGSDVERLTATGKALNPAWSPDGSTIAFESTVGNPHIALMPVAGGAENSLALGHGPPAWSPDGTRIAFVDLNDDISAINSDGSAQADLTSAPGSEFGPAWSPDGTMIAFGRVPAGSPDSDVYLMTPTGADQRDLTNSPAADLMPGSWSPDGTRIAFSVFQDGIYVINADGSGRRRLTSSAMVNSVGDAQPSWSPDGTKIVFTRVVGGNCTGPPVPWVGSQCKQLWVMNADGSNQTELTDNPGGGDSSPSWGIVAPTPAPPEDVIAHERGPTPIGAFHGRLVWSSFDPSSGLYSLVSSSPGAATPERLPVKPRAVPFDVDVGPDARGRAVAVYSRCSSEPNGRYAVNLVAAYDSGRGCDLYRYDFATGRESRIRSTSTPGGSEFLPTIWKDRIAFARVWEQRRGKAGALSYIYTRRLDRPNRSQRLPGGPFGQWRFAHVGSGRRLVGGPGPTALDLRQRQLAVTWGYRLPGGASGSQIQLDTLSGATKVIARADTHRMPNVTVVFGSLAHEGLFWVQQGNDDSTSPSLFNTFRRYNLENGQTTIAPAPEFLTSSVRDDRLVLYTRAVEPIRSSNRIPPCGRPAARGTLPADCLVARTTPTYRAVPAVAPHGR